MNKKLIVLLVAVCIGGMLAAEGNQEDAPMTIVFADLSWDSVMVHNRIMGYIIENGLENDYIADYVAGGTVPSVTGLANGDIDVDMESWHSNWLDVYEKFTSSGEIIDLGKNLPDGPQGWYVPRYVIEGDPERGIEAMAPDLKTSEDLPRYWELFRDKEDPTKGLIYLGISGWAITDSNEQVFVEKGLDKYFNKAIPGSSAAVAATMDAAYRRGDPWVGYWWEPTAIMGRLDMVMLPDTQFPPADINILVNSKLPERAPDIVEILKKYTTTVDMNNEFLAMKEKLGVEAEGAAVWFLKNREDVWTEWVSPDVEKRVKAALAGE
jgi:glycine betaine/proline transport system substrate-binding protein